MKPRSFRRTSGVLIWYNDEYMSRSLASLVIVALVFGGGYWYYTAFAGCQVPITYRVGSIDERFRISEDEVRTAISTAESIWEDGTDRNLFTYDENGKIIINFVYDERQERADKEEDFREVLEEKEEVSDSVKEEYNNLLEKYETLRASYHRAAQSYESELTAYNAEVADWNTRGGAPKDVYERLNATQEALSKEENRLDSVRTQLNTLVRKINALGATGNEIITDYNSLVNEYNTEFSEATEFTQGDYQNKVINIYEFGSPDELSIVMAHEFGHALGIDHVTAETSVMYHHLQNQSVEEGLTPEDLEAFLELCGTPTTFSDTIRLIGESFKALAARI